MCMCAMQTASIMQLLVRHILSYILILDLQLLQLFAHLFVVIIVDSIHYIAAIVDSYCLYFITDINECLNNNSGCSHDCVNTVGSYHCACPSGHVLQLDHHTCKGESIPLHIIKSDIFISNFI